MESLRKESFSSDLNSNTSKRESIESMNRSMHKNYSERKVSVDKRYLDKLIKFCKNIIQELNIDSKEIKLIEKFIQTDENVNDTFENYKAEEILDFTEANNSLKIEIDNLQKKIINLSSLNYDLTERNSLMDNLVKSKEIEKVKLENQISLLNDKIELLKTQLEEEISAKSRLEEENILLVQENQIIQIKEAEVIEEKNDDTNSILYNEKYNRLILNFLEPIDILNFALVDRKINKNFLANNLQIKAYKASIESKNKEIIMLKSVDWIRDYNISEPEVDRLVREYIQQNKIPGMDLKNMTIKALNYIEQEVKRPLGLSTKEEEKKSKSIIGSLNQMFNKIVKKEEGNKQNNPKKSVIIENLEDYDKYLISELNANELYVKFDFASSDEIKNLLVQFFTSLKNSPQIITNFIAELISEYSDFLFYSSKTLSEIKELDIVKSAMHERFKKYHKICLELENEMDDLQKFAKTNKEIKDILLKQKLEIEVKYTDSITQITYYKDELNKTSNKLLNINEKYNKMESENEGFKNKLVKEFKLLKNEYHSVEKERDMFKDAILEFKKYFMRFHITEEGEIAYIDNF